MIRRTFYSPPEVVRSGLRWKLIWRYSPDSRYDVVSYHLTSGLAWRAAGRKGLPPEPPR